MTFNEFYFQLTGLAYQKGVALPSKPKIKNLFKAAIEISGHDYIEKGKLTRLILKTSKRSQSS